MLYGIIKPPSNMDGTNTSCDQRMVMRELGETTPISTLRPAQANAREMKQTRKFIQFAGSGALNNRGAVNEIIAATITKCTIVVIAGMINMEKEGTPLIL